MTTKAPPIQRKFYDDWDRAEYLYERVLYWWYQRENFRRADVFADRLIDTLQRVDPGCEAILTVSSLALVAEMDGNLPKAIKFRWKEIGMIKKLLEMGAPATFGYGHDSVSDRLDLLAIVYWNQGELEKARATLQESKAYCRRHHVPFDGQDLMNDIQKELAETARNGPPARSKVRSLNGQTRARHG